MRIGSADEQVNLVVIYLALEHAQDTSFGFQVLVGFFVFFLNKANQLPGDFEISDSGLSTMF